MSLFIAVTCFFPNLSPIDSHTVGTLNEQLASEFNFQPKILWHSTDNRVPISVAPWLSQRAIRKDLDLVAFLWTTFQTSRVVGMLHNIEEQPDPGCVHKSVPGPVLATPTIDHIRRCHCDIQAQLLRKQGLHYSM